MTKRKGYYLDCFREAVRLMTERPELDGTTASRMAANNVDAREAQLKFITPDPNGFSETGFRRFWPVSNLG